MMDEDAKRLARDVARLTRQRNEYAEVFVAMTARTEAAEAKLARVRERLGDAEPTSLFSMGAAVRDVLAILGGE